MKQETECFAQLEGIAVLFKVFDSSSEGLALVLPSRVEFFQYEEINRIVVRERLL